MNVFDPDLLKKDEKNMAMTMSFFFEDPITLDYMEDAVMGPCGHSFSSDAIQGWLEKNDGGEVKCPTCNTTIREEDMRPNFKLREVIQYYKTQKEKRSKAEEGRREEDHKVQDELREKLRQEEEQRQQLTEENLRLAELERRYVEQVEELTRRQEVLRLEMVRRAEEEEQQRREKELKEKGEVDKIMEKAVAEKRRYEELERKYQDLQKKFQLQTKQMEDLKNRYRGMEKELSEVKDKYRTMALELRKKEEEEKKNSNSTGLMSYIPFSAPAVPSFSISSWVWGSSTVQPGPLVRKISGYKIDGRRGSNRNSPVWRAIKIEGNEVVAVKRLPFREDIMVFREAMLHHQLSHPNVLPLQGIMKGDVKDEYYMILPFVEYDLDHVMSAMRFNGAQIRHFMYQLILVVCFMHSAGVVHRDIQPSSVMVSNSGQGRIWLGSLGSARSLASKNCDPLSTATTFLGYRAPEVILSAGPLLKALSDNDWREADIWSCGCIFAQLLTRTPFFVGTGSDQVLRSILSYADCRESIGDMGVNRFTSLNTHPAISEGPRTSFIEVIRARSKGSDTPSKGKGKEKMKDYEIERDKEEEELLVTAHDLLKQMLTFDPDRRISALEALSHPYFEGYRSLMQQKPTLWKCPLNRAVLFEDNQVASFLQNYCTTLLG